MRSYWLDLSNPAHRILYKFGLSARGKTELEILKELSRGSANMYALNKKLKARGRIDVHYSTVLRAFERLEEKKLVRVVPQKDAGRRKKTYACTLVGEIVVALAKNGISGATRIIAENSQSFRKCLVAHLSFDSNYPLAMTESIILNIVHEQGEAVVRSDLDAYVRKTELEWVEKSIVEALNHNLSSRSDYYYDYGYLSRPEILKYLRKITHIDWVSDWVVQFIEKYVESKRARIDKYVEKENEWLQTLKDFMREAKLAKSFIARGKP